MVQDEGSLSTCPGGTLRFLLLRCISSRNSLDQARHQGSLGSGGDTCGTCENLSLIELMNDDSRQLKGKGVEYVWCLTLAHKKMGGRGPVDGTETV